uniref:Uncharacterized protein n=1 Tax=Ditylenchus dipsaci TaxID=166011 RepID=A0A915D7U3_9BILA
MISIFDDDDSYVNLSSLSAVFNQLNFSKINVGEAVKEVKWYLTGDLKFVDMVYGHLGSSATRPCPIGECPKMSFKENRKHPQRTIHSLEQGFLRHTFYTQDNYTLTSSQVTALRRDCRSVTKMQLLPIEPSNCIPRLFISYRDFAKTSLKPLRKKFLRVSNNLKPYTRS